MKTFAILTAFVAALAVAGCSNSSGPAASAGPNGGDLVPIKSGTAYAELLANADTGAILVTTWDKDLKTRRPIEEKPITVGSGEKSLELLPHPMDTDPSGTCSRFYGEAEWIRGGGIRNGWMHGGGTGNHQEFAWQRRWQAGRAAPCGRRWASTTARGQDMVRCITADVQKTKPVWQIRQAKKAGPRNEPETLITPDAAPEQNGVSPAKSAYSTRPAPRQGVFGTTASIRKRGISGRVDKSGASDCWRPSERSR